MTDPKRRVEPLPVAPGAGALRAVLAVLARIPRARVLERDEASVHAVIRSAVLRVPLDVEILVTGASNGASGAVHVRASTPLTLRDRSHPRTRARELLARIDRELRKSN